MAPRKKKEETGDDKPAKKEHKLDIFAVLGQADRKNFEFYSKLTDEEKKAFVPLVVMRWFSTVSDGSGMAPYQVFMTNEVVNCGFWELYKHPELQWKLMCVAGSGQQMRHQWIPGIKKQKSTLMEKMLRHQYPSISQQEMELLISLQDVESVEEFAKGLAWSDEEIRNVVKEFKALNRG